MKRNQLVGQAALWFALWVPVPILGQHVEIQEFIQKHCFECHDHQSAEGELDLETLLQRKPLVRNLRTWKNIAKRIELGDMPPADSETLKPSQKKFFADWYRKSIHGFDYDSIRHPGYEPIRRLSHVEYQNTIRDLFGVDVANIDRFPMDLSGNSGFGNSANTLFIQGSLLEKYAQSAEAILEEVFDNSSDPVFKQARDLLLAAGKNPGNARDRARRILQAFCNRAYRRPASKLEVQQLLGLFEMSFRTERNFEKAIRKSLAAVLIMPQFLMKVESTPPSSQATRVKAHDLANRLSYFLWASMPDDELFRLAESGALLREDVLEKQVDRMLKNRRAKSLGYVFAAEWLGFDELGVRRRQDPIDNPWCTESLMQAMRDESTLFFYSLIRDNRPVSELISARYTYLNEELARHYRIRGIRGNEMRPVRLKTSRRGGILTHGSVLSVTAFPDRTSPVVRGKWILETVLGTPPPEPPPNVSELSEQIEDRDLSFREKLKLHSRSRNCQSCHQEIDPLGFSLENYDNFGRWRSFKDGQRVDAKDRLPNGTQFEGPQGLIDVLIRQRRDDLTRQLAEKMLTYALGRQLEYFDEAAIRKIVKETKADQYRFQTLVKQVISSYPFQYQKRQRNEVTK